MTTKLFTKTVEDFVCANCGCFNFGDGFTNHCSKCLYSKHVDLNPGDRKAICRSLMKPVSLEQKDGEFVIIHECTACKFVRKNKASVQDNFEAVIQLTH